MPHSLETPSSSADTLTAIVVAYESALVLRQCLESLAAQNVRAIVVDNASTDNSAEIAKSLGAKVIINEKNEGFGRAMNIGVNAATSEFCLLINPDTTLDADCISNLLKAADAHPEAAILAPEIRESDGRIFFHERSLLNSLPHRGRVREGALHEESSSNAPLPTSPLRGEEKYASFVSGACMLVQRDWFLHIGGFDERIFLFYEDDDLCRRAIDSGRKILHVPNAKILHLRGKSVTPSLHHTYAVRYHQAWSRAYVCKKYGLPHPALKLGLISLGKLLFALLTFKKQKIMRHLGSFKGNLDALYNFPPL